MDSKVKKIILQVMKKYEYQSIILFGSRARQDYQEQSDYDLLIIMKNNIEIQDLRKIQMEIRKELALNDIDADVLVKTQIMVDNYKNKKGNVIYNAMKEGVLI